MSGRPNPLVPNFNNPTSGLKPPRAKPAPKKTAPKRGPYSKPVKYKPNTHYAPNTPVTVGGKTILTKGPVNTGSRASKPAPAKSLDRPAPKTLKGQQKAAARKKAYQSQPSLAEQVSGLPANTLGLMPLVHRIAGGLMGSGPGNDAVIIPGEGSLVDQVAEHLTNGVNAGKTIEGIANARQAAHEALLASSKGNPQRAIHIGDFTAEGPGSRTGVLPWMQRKVDTRAQKWIDNYPAEPGMSENTRVQMALAHAPRDIKKNVSNLIKTNEHFTNRSQRAPAEALRTVKPSLPEQVALDMVQNETSPAIYKLHLQRALEDAKGSASKKALQNQLDALPEASTLVKEVKASESSIPTRLKGNHPTVDLSEAAHPRMWHWVNEMLAESSKREQIVKKMGLVKPGTMVERRSAPGRVMRGARKTDTYIPATNDMKIGSPIRIDGKYPGKYIGLTKDGKALVHLFRAGKGAKPITYVKPFSELEEKTGTALVGAEDFKGGRFFTSSRREEKLAGLGRFRPGNVIQNTLRKPTGMGGQYLGKHRLAGLENINVPKVVGEDRLSVQRYAAGMDKISWLQEHALTGVEIPDDLKNFIAVRLGPASHNDMVTLANAINTIKEGEKPSAKVLALVSRKFKGYFDHWVQEEFNAEALREQGSHGFIEKHLAGDLRQWDPTSEFERKFAAFSNYMKYLFVYTKIPGHIPPRYTSNRIFNVMHMGIQMFPSAVKARSLAHQFPEEAKFLLAQLGHGGFASIAETRTQKALVRPIVEAADNRPRLTAAVYEMQKIFGKRMSVGEIAQATQAMREAPDGSPLAKALKDLGQRGDVGAGNYDRLNNFERKWLTKFWFLYTWHRTAAVTTTKFALEHPFKAAAAGAGMYELNEKLNKGKPPWNIYNSPAIPSNIPFLGGKTSNLTTSLPFSQVDTDLRTLVSSGGALAGLHGPILGEQLGGELNPVITLSEAALNQRNPETGTALKGFLSPVTDTLRSTPPAALVFGKKSIQDRVGKFLWGNQWPTTEAGTTSGGGGGTIRLNHHQMKILRGQLKSIHLSHSDKKILRKKLGQIQVVR